ncbi:MAG: hypothetical protein U1E47_06005 [Rivihabitans pingtungensis]
MAHPQAATTAKTADATPVWPASRQTPANASRCSIQDFVATGRATGAHPCLRWQLDHTAVSEADGERRRSHRAWLPFLHYLWQVNSH